MKEQKVYFNINRKGNSSSCNVFAADSNERRLLATLDVDISLAYWDEELPDIARGQELPYLAECLDLITAATKENPCWVQIDADNEL